MESTNVNELSFFDEKPADLLRDHRYNYLMVNAIARRVRQLQLGERALALPEDGSRDPLYIAQAEFMNDKLAITPRDISRLYEDYNEMPSPLDAMLSMDEEEVSFDGADDED